MHTLDDLRNALSELETAGDAVKVEQFVLSPNGQRARRRRHATPIIAAAAAVLAVALGSVVLAGHIRPSTDHAGGSTPVVNPVHPGLDQLTKSCLNQAQVLKAWGTTSGSDYGGIAYTKPDGTPCTYEAENIQPTHPTPRTSVTAGHAMIYLAPTTAGIRTGYIALTSDQVAAQLKSAHQAPDPTRHLYRVVSIPADNPQSVLVTILGQTPSLYPQHS